MRDSGWDQLPPDVRFAGKPAEMRAPPWITDCPHQLLTEIPSCEAEHMAAPTNAAFVRKSLANSEPSIHGTLRTSRDVRVESVIGGRADIRRGGKPRGNRLKKPRPPLSSI